jgi:hypothetical protein
MARVLRTSTRPGEQVKHTCRDARGRRVEGKAACNTVCTKCNTQIVFIRNDKLIPNP